MSARGILQAAAGAGLLLLAGCATPLSRVKFTDPRVGFLAKAAAGDETGKAEFAALIADARLEEIRRAGLPAADCILLEQWERYVDLLSKPIELSPDLLAGAPDLKPVGSAERERLESFAAGAPESLRIEGARSSAKWRSEIESARARLRVLESQRGAAMAAAAKAERRGLYDAAAAEYKRALAYRPDDEVCRDAIRQALLRWMFEEADALGSDLRSRELRAAAAAASVFGTARAGLAAVADAEAALDSAGRRLESERNSLAAALAPDGFEFEEVDHAFGEIESDLDELRGRCWGERIRLHAQTNAYWQAYRQAVARVREAGSLAPWRGAALRRGIGRAYSAMLPAALSYYVNLANDSSDTYRYGTALTLCLMAQEMSDYARSQSFEVTDDVAVWDGRAAESRQFASVKIESRLARLLVIRDFMPTVTEEGQSLAFQLWDRCRNRYSPPNDIAWALKVERSFLGLRIEEQQKKPEEIGPNDILIEGKVVQLAVKDLPPEELSREPVRVGGAVSPAPNPFWQFDKNLPPLVSSQEVFVFEKVLRRRAKRADLELDVKYTCRGESFPLCRPVYAFTDSVPDLAGVVFSGVETNYSTPFLGTPRISYATNALAPEEWPRSVAARLSPDDEIRARMMELALALLMERMDWLVGSFPVKTLVPDAIEAEKQRKAVEIAEGWGRCLLYFAKLAEAGAPGLPWLELRALMERRIAQWRLSRWSDADPRILDRLDRLWETCVASALDAVGSGRPDGASGL